MAGDALEAGRPASFLRLGDGEGALLGAALRRHPALAEYAATDVGARHLGSPAALTQADPDLFERYRAALVNATVVGIPNGYTLKLLLGMNRERPRAAFGILSIFEYLDELGREGLLSSVTAASFTYGRELYDDLPGLICGRDVVLVCCHEQLGPAVRERFGARSVTVLPVPVQAVLREGGAVGPTGHYPERYRELLVELAEVPAGSLVLVAAGILAEVYCEVARAAGAVAIDVGSVVDVWAGLPSRVLSQPPELFERHQIVVRRQPGG